MCNSQSKLLLSFILDRMKCDAMVGTSSQCWFVWESDGNIWLVNLLLAQHISIWSHITLMLDDLPWFLLAVKVLLVYFSWNLRTHYYSYTTDYLRWLVISYVCVHDFEMHAMCVFESICHVCLDHHFETKQMTEHASISRPNSQRAQFCRGLARCGTATRPARDYRNRCVKWGFKSEATRSKEIIDYHRKRDKSMMN